MATISELQSILFTFIPKTIYEVNENGWYYYNPISWHATEEEALKSIKMTKEEYEQYKHDNRFADRILSIEEINTEEYLKNCYNYIIDKTKKTTIEDEANKIKIAGQETIDASIQDGIENRFNEFFHHMLKFVKEQYKTSPNWDET